MKTVLSGNGALADGLLSLRAPLVMALQNLRAFDPISEAWLT